jgi:hypothetical protein
MRFYPVMVGNGTLVNVDRKDVREGLHEGDCTMLVPFVVLHRFNGPWYS